MYMYMYMYYNYFLIDIYIYDIHVIIHILVFYLCSLCLIIELYNVSFGESRQVMMVTSDPDQDVDIDCKECQS